MKYDIYCVQHVLSYLNKKIINIFFLINTTIEEFFHSFIPQHDERFHQYKIRNCIHDVMGV